MVQDTGRVEAGLSWHNVIIPKKEFACQLTFLPASPNIIHQGGKIQLMVRDDGCGFDAEKAMMPKKNRNSIGLSSMKERCELLGGSFSVHSRKGEGTAIYAEWVCN